VCCCCCLYFLVNWNILSISNQLLHNIEKVLCHQFLVRKSSVTRVADWGYIYLKHLYGLNQNLGFLQWA
jgi:hypothetical protein